MNTTTGFKTLYGRLDDTLTLREVSLSGDELAVATAFGVVDESASQSEIQSVFREQVVGKLLGVYREIVLAGDVSAPARMVVEHETPDGDVLSWAVSAGQVRRLVSGEVSIRGLFEELDESLEIVSDAE